MICRWSYSLVAATQNRRPVQVRLHGRSLEAIKWLTQVFLGSNQSLLAGLTATPRNWPEKVTPWTHSLSSTGHESLDYALYFLFLRTHILWWWSTIWPLRCQSIKNGWREYCFAFLSSSVCNKINSFFWLLKVLWSHVSEPVSLTELVVVLINIMYQHPGPLPSDTLQTGGVGTLTHAHTHTPPHVNHVIDFGTPPWFLVSLNKRTRRRAPRKYLLLPALSLVCHRW